MRYISQACMSSNSMRYATITITDSHGDDIQYQW